MAERPLQLTVITACALAAAILLCSSGCQEKVYTERFVRSGICRPDGKEIPVWVQGELPVSDDEVYFVGRGVAQNCFDERGAYDAAVEHVIEQVAQQVGTTVGLQAGRHGESEARSAAKMATHAMVGDIEPRDVYWEQWSLEEASEELGAGGAGKQLYKCWVLMAIPKEAMARRVAATARALKLKAAGPDTLFSSAGSHSVVEPR